MHTRLLAALLVLLLSACSGERSDLQGFRSPEALPVGKLPQEQPQRLRLDLTMHRAAHALPADSFRTIEQVLTWYRAHFNAEETTFLNVLLFEETEVPDSFAADRMYGFLRNKAWQSLLDSVMTAYPEGDTLFGVFDEPLRRYYSLFKDDPMPALCTYVTGFQDPGYATMDPYLVAGTNIGKLYAGLGLHYALGPDFGWYPNDIPNYVRRRFSRSHLLPGLLLQLITRRMPETPPNAREPLLNHMVRAGIKYYALDVLLPDAPDSLKIGYTAPQTVFAQAYLDRIWGEMLPLLYDTEQLNYRHWLDDAPYTKGLQLESPPRLGAYVGWQMVRSYIQRHPETRLKDLLLVTDYDRILRESGFRP